MPVEFISNGYDTTPEKPYGEGVWADSHPVIGLASYGVRSALDWKVTAVAGQDRTVAIAAGRGYGHGVTDKTIANDTIQLDTISSGSRWDLIACRRDWTPTSGVSQFVKVNGGATAVIPGGRLLAPGEIDDQPIALVQVTSGQTQPTSIIDLRTWAGDGGGLVANHDLVRSYMDATGTRLNINGTDWVRRVGANDTPEWVKVSEIGKVPLFGLGGSLEGGSLAGAAQFLIQAGSTVQDTDQSGYARITWPKPFPNGLLTVIAVDGDDWASGGSMSVHGSGRTDVWGAEGMGSRTSWVYALTSQPASPNGDMSGNNLVVGRHGQYNKRHRINWIAIGW